MYHIVTQVDNIDNRENYMSSIDVDSVDVSITFAQIGMLQIQSTALLLPASLSTSQPIG